MRCENIERRAKDLRELGDHRMKRRMRRRRSAEDDDQGRVGGDTEIEGGEQ